LQGPSRGDLTVVVERHANDLEHATILASDFGDACGTRRRLQEFDSRKLAAMREGSRRLSRATSVGVIEPSRRWGYLATIARIFSTELSRERWASLNDFQCPM
jgi:hypothetical protein